VSLRLERDKLPLTLNVGRQKGEWARRKELADWRAWAAAEADGYPPISGSVSVIVTHLRKNRAAMPDCGAPILAVKAVIDGIVDAGVLAEDGPAVVRRLVFERPEIVGYHGLRVEIREDGAEHPMVVSA
jgi:hypothetical protein